MLQFTAEDALYKIYGDTLDFFEDRLYGIEPDLSKKLEVPEKPPGEYCNELVKEFRANIMGQPVEQIKKYTEALYYNLVYKLLKLRECHMAYIKRFGMDSDNERLANVFMAPLSILVTNIWNAGWYFRIAELVKFGDVDLKADFDLSGTYKPLFSYEEYAQKEYKRKLAAMSGPPTYVPTTHIDSNQPVEGELPKVEKSKKPQARPFANFTEKLQNGFTKKDLDALLVHLNFVNSNGETLLFTKYLLHHVIDALIKQGYFDGGNREKDQKALSRYLGIEETRVTVEHGKSKKSIREKAEVYLVELKNQRKINR